MNKPFGLALFVGGVILLAFGLNASQSIASEFSRFFTGHPTDKAVWMIIGGAVLAILGLSTTARRAG